MIIRSLTIFFCLIAGFIAYSQTDEEIYKKYDLQVNPVRILLNKFSFTFDIGYGLTEYRHDLTGFRFYQDPETQMVLSKDVELGPEFNGYTDWTNNPQPGTPGTLSDITDVPFNYISNPVFNPLNAGNVFVLDGDSLGLSFQNMSPSIPVSLSVHYNFRKIRVGGGLTYMQQFVRPMKPSVLQDIIRPYQPNFSSAGFTRFWGVFGYQFYDWWDYTFVAELRLGINKYGKNFDQHAFTGGPFYNIGINIEKNLSEYFRVVVRPSYDIKRYSITFPDGAVMKHSANAFLVQFGISINIPEIPRSPMKSDHIQLKHVLSDREGNMSVYRGQPIWKVQNPKVGQNHRRLWRYKLKNRRKIDPY